METKNIRVGNRDVYYYLNGARWELPALLKEKRCFVITDSIVYKKYRNYLVDIPLIIVNASERNKDFSIVEAAMKQMISLRINRSDLLIGWGGGVICDLVGILAGIYKVGIDFAYIPTTITAMIGAAISNKHTVNLEYFKGLSQQYRFPEFVFFDYSFLDSLTIEEWSSGFAEIIRHACVFDESMFEFLEAYGLSDFRKDRVLLHQLISWDLNFRLQLLQNSITDVSEVSALDFGIIMGRALTKSLDVRYGSTIGLGMYYNCLFAKEKAGFSGFERVVNLIRRYHIGLSLSFELKWVMRALHADEHVDGDAISLMVLEKIGCPLNYSVDFEHLSRFFMTANSVD